MSPSEIQCSTAVGERPGLALKLLQGERDISGFDWPFTPIHGSSLRFQPKWVRPSTGSTPASACPWIAHPASRPRRADYVARLKDSPSLRLGSNLNLAARRDSLAHSTKKARRHTALGAPTACGRTVSGAVSLPPGVLFTFPSRYSFAIGHRRVFSLGGWSPCFGPGFTCPALLRKSFVGGGFAYGAVTRCGRPFHAVPLPPVLSDHARERRPEDMAPRPPCGNAGTLNAHGFGLARFRSPLLPRSRLISLPPGT